MISAVDLVRIALYLADGGDPADLALVRDKHGMLKPVHRSKLNA